jgi:hypothetical protein
MRTAVAARLVGCHLTWEDVNDNNLSSIRPGLAYVRLNWGQPGAEWDLMAACRG